MMGVSLSLQPSYGLHRRLGCCTGLVIPREGGVSSTPRPIDFIISVSGILDRPPSRAMTVVGDEYRSRLKAKTTSIKPMEMMDRPVAMADAETIGGGDCGTDPALGVANRGFEIVALRKPRGDG
jgi:hypothetical protein